MTQTQTASHTPGPWYMEPQQPIEGIGGIKELGLQSLAVKRDNVTYVIGEMLLPSDAARIVACVNFCEGVGESKMRTHGNLANLDSAYNAECENNSDLHNESDKLRAQNAELLAALKGFSEAVGELADGNIYVSAQVIARRMADFLATNGDAK